MRAGRVTCSRLVRFTDPLYLCWTRCRYPSLFRLSVPTLRQLFEEVPLSLAHLSVPSHSKHTISRLYLIDSPQSLHLEPSPLPSSLLAAMIPQYSHHKCAFGGLRTKLPGLNDWHFLPPSQPPTHQTATSHYPVQPRLQICHTLACWWGSSHLMTVIYKLYSFQVGRLCGII